MDRTRRVGWGSGVKEDEKQGKKEPYGEKTKNIATGHTDASSNGAAAVMVVVW